MGKWKWIVIVLVLLAAAALTAPKTMFEVPCTYHEYEWSENCQVSTCVKCGYRNRLNWEAHSWKLIDCQSQKCVQCGVVRAVTAHKDGVFCTEGTRCEDCGYQYRTVYHGNRVVEVVTSCRSVETCADCGKVTRENIQTHTWEGNCLEQLTCTECGQTDGPRKYHQPATFILPGINRCQICGHIELPGSAYRFWLLFCVLGGAVMVALGFWYLWKNRKRIRIRGGPIWAANPEGYPKKEEGTPWH